MDPVREERAGRLRERPLRSLYRTRGHCHVGQECRFSGVNERGRRGRAKRPRPTKGHAGYLSAPPRTPALTLSFEPKASLFFAIGITG